MKIENVSFNVEDLRKNMSFETFVELHKGAFKTRTAESVAIELGLKKSTVKTTTSKPKRVKSK